MDRPEGHLPDTIGRRYRVESHLGMGGMGVVYKATDTQLNRAVAIKVIHRSRSRGGHNRLRAEALAAASIDHPYICKVYELIEEGEDAYLVMEFVAGETLAAILQRGTPPLTQTIRLVSEVVEGLATAHARGLVHRDVKPSNVMVTLDGHAKLLDFGLAREDVISTPADRTRTPQPDQSAHAGTPRYMSPEQAEGRPITARADLFSVGVVLFESVTGQLPFDGTSPYDYVRHLLTDRPRRLDRLAPGAPTNLVDLVERCLEKTPADRPESAAALLAALREIGNSLTATGTGFNTAGAERARRRWRAAAAAIATVATAGLLWQWFGSSPPTEPLRRSRSLVTWPSEEFSSRVSPDSRWVSFISTRDGGPQLYVQPVSGTDAHQVALTAGRVLSHAWSPEGDRLACAIRRPDGVVIQVVPAFFGGPPTHTVSLDMTSLSILRWTDQRLFVSASAGTGRDLLVVDLTDGSVTNLSRSWDIDGALLSVDVRPDGREAVLSVQSGTREDLWVTPVDRWSPRRLTDDAFYAKNPVWNGVADEVIYSTNRGGQDDLWLLHVESGRHVSLTSSETEERAGGTSNDGLLITFSQNADEARLWFFDATTSTSRQLTAGALSDFAPVLSATGGRIAFQRSEPSPSHGYNILNSQLFVAPVSQAKLTADPQVVADGFAAALSPDGSWLAYKQRGEVGDRTELHVKQLDTDDTIRVSTSARLSMWQLYPVDWAEQLVTWGPTSDSLYYVDQPDEQQIRQYRVGSAAPEPPIVSMPAESYLRDLHVSPDGRRIGFLAWTGDGFDLHMVDLHSGQDRVMARLAGPFRNIFGRGWLANGDDFVLVRATARHDDNSADVEFLLASVDGPLRVAGTATQTFEGTVRLDPAQALLYFTRTEGAVHNLYAFSPTTRTIRQVTDNTLQGVTYSGITPVPGSGVMAVRDQRRRDIWVIETTSNRND